MNYLAFHEDLDEQHKFSFLLRQTLRHQVAEDLYWEKERKLLYGSVRRKLLDGYLHVD